MKKIKNILLIVLVSLGTVGIAQQVSTYAGIGVAGYSGDNGLAVNAKINSPYGLVSDSEGNIFFSDQGTVIRRVDKATKIITTVVDGDHQGSVLLVNELTIDNDIIYFLDQDGSDYNVLKFSATDYTVSLVGQVFQDYIGICAQGDSIFLTNSDQHVIDLFIISTGTVTPFAGVSGTSGDTNGLVATALFNLPMAIDFDLNGDLIVGEFFGGSVRKIDLTTLLVSTIASGLSAVEGVHVAPDGVIYVAENGGNKITMIDHAGVVSTLAGSGNAGFMDGDANVASFDAPIKVAVDSDNNIYVSDNENSRIRHIGCDAADLPLLKTSTNSIEFCNESPIDWFIYVDSTSSALNENEHWKWYTTSCGGEELVVADTLYVNPTETTSYFVRGEGGCFQNGECQEITLFLLGCDSLEAIHGYSAFSPNNDGVNDVWIIDGIESYSQNKVYIYNRWGDLISKIDNYNNVDKIWNGVSITYEGVAAGTYYYVIEDINNKKLKSGWVQVIR